MEALEYEEEPEKPVDKEAKKKYASYSAKEM
jgi:hypothetical protein